MQNKTPFALTILIFFAVVAGVYSNVAEQRAIDRSKIPQKVEESRGFQRWLTNLRNNDLTTEADEFRLLEENEIYNTKWMTISSIDEPGKREEFEQNLETHKDIAKIIMSPSEREFIDYRSIDRDGYKTNEAHFYGLKDDKIIDARILDCSIRANCYFDRAYFLDNDVFVISEFSRNIDKKDQTTPVCPIDQICTYTIKVHVIDLVNNSRLIYESKPLEINLAELIPQL